MTQAQQLQQILRAVSSVDALHLERARAHHLRLTKPAGSLGRLEDLGAQLCAIAARTPPPLLHRPAIAVFAGDHGVLAEGVTSWPAEVTAQMVGNFCAGGAAINVLANHIGARLVVVDVGVASPLTHLHHHPDFRSRNIRYGTDNLAQGPAMTPEEALTAVLVGAAIAGELVDEGADLLVGGDMGIGNTTASAALIAAATGADALTVTGRGTGIDDAMLARKQAAVAAGLSRWRQQHATTDVDADPMAVLAMLAELGGLEIAALAGFFLGGAARKVPVVLDGVIALAAACCAAALCPPAVGYFIAGHRSSEPAATVALRSLALEPLLDLQLRLGEGSGAALAVPLIRAAAAVMHEMATFDAADIDGSEIDGSTNDGETEAVQ
ncbi:MAG: nicotinate-nucleotide--dimethylbenzimidazole phosphoribosyltransferase [Acidimicrobiales bacterium]